MFRLAHISDLHFFSSMNVPLTRLLGKRALGYANLYFHRRFQHDPRLIRLLMENLKEQKVDHIVVTGDLTNLSLGEEFGGIRELLLQSGFSPRDISVVPGNHDRYTKGAQSTLRFEAYLAPFMGSDIELWDHNFPYVRLRDGVAIVGINSALSLPPFMAGGKVGVEQLTRLEVILEHPELKSRFIVFLIHHPPYRHPVKRLHFMEGLSDYRVFLKAIRGRPSLILHGHLHRNFQKKINHNGTELLTSCVSSSSYKLKGLDAGSISTFKLYDLDGNGVRSVRWFQYNSEKSSYEPDGTGEKDFSPLNI
ncbi:MAG: metallophosphoesterase [Pseudomonadota bacterium]